jgi:hypothetical protein
MHSMLRLTKLLSCTVALSKVAAIWISCVALVRARIVEPKVISTRLVLQLAVAFGLAVWFAEIVNVTVRSTVLFDTSGMLRYEALVRECT